VNLTEIRERLAQIDSSKRDPEVAHGQEDRLFADVLRAVAEGTAGPDEAREALKAEEIRFPRWYA
jgi:hypothetical protein